MTGHFLQLQNPYAEIKLRKKQAILLFLSLTEPKRENLFIFYIIYIIMCFRFFNFKLFYQWRHSSFSEMHK